MLILNSTT